jgi:hypothetical protein
MLSRSEASLSPSSQTLRGVDPERSEWAQGDTVRHLRLMLIEMQERVPAHFEPRQLNRQLR